MSYTRHYPKPIADTGVVAAILAAGCAPLAVVATVLAFIGAICWPYTINTWLVLLGKTAVITWWQGALLGLVPGLGQAGIPLAVGTYIATLFI